MVDFRGASANWGTQTVPDAGTADGAADVTSDAMPE